MTALALSWLPFTLYALAALPQIITNYRLRSAAGVSTGMLFIRLTSIALYLIYIFACWLTPPYRFMMPLYFFMLSVVALQAYIYSTSEQVRSYMCWGFGGVFSFVLILSLLAWRHPQIVGLYCGWLSAQIALFSELPQVYHNWQRKSVAGFNFLFISCIGIGAAIELTTAVILRLPWPTIFTTSRAVTFYIIYCIQFMLYKKR